MEGMGELSNRKDLSPVGEAHSEGTKIEQTRAFAEVMVQAELAKKFPRRMDDVFRRIDETFERSPLLVASAKYSYPRGGEEISGYTIDFARAVAQCSGNVYYSIKEMAREGHQSEIMAYAWDLETNAMQARTVIVPHTRDSKAKGKVALTDDRDIYENNTNNGARRLRECILGVLPAAAVKHAEEKVEELLRKAFPDDKVKQYIDENIKRYAALGVSKRQLVGERGNRPPEMWTRDDFATLAVHHSQIKSGLATIAEIFGEPEIKPRGKTAAEVQQKVEEGGGGTAGQPTAEPGQQVHPVAAGSPAGEQASTGGKTVAGSKGQREIF